MSQNLESLLGLQALWMAGSGEMGRKSVYAVAGFLGPPGHPTHPVDYFQRSGLYFGYMEPERIRI